jgi:tetratricopeptide (TPR) repeat protein
MAEQLSDRTQIATRIVGQLRRSLEADRPLLILLLYDHEGEKVTFLETLRRLLIDHGFESRTFDPVHREEHGKGRLYSALREGGERGLCLVTGLPRAETGTGPDPEFLDYLNIHRDRITDWRLRLVVCLHTSEADAFITLAGDLWDFRHHTCWLERPAGIRDTGLWEELTQQTERLPEASREEVAEHIARVRKLVAKTDANEEKASIILDLTRWMMRRQIYRQAVSAGYEASAYLDSETSKLQAEVEHELGMALHNAGYRSEALHHYETCLGIQRRIGDRAGEGATLNNIGDVYLEWSRYNDALLTYENSLEIYRKVGDRAGEGTSLNNIGAVYHSWCRYDDALKTFEQSLAIHRSVGDRAGEGTTLNNIGLALRNLGRNDDGLRAFEQSLAIRREVGDRAGEGTTLNNMGLVFRAWDRHDDALRSYEQSLAISREVGDRAGEGTTLNNIGFVYRGMGRLEDALHTYLQSLAISREVGNRAVEGTTLNNIGFVLREMGRQEDALRTYGQSLEIHREVGNRTGEVTTLNNIGALYRELGCYDDALRTLKKGLAIRREIGDRAGEGTTLKNIGELYQDMGLHENSQLVFEQSREIRREIGDSETASAGSSQSLGIAE